MAESQTDLHDESHDESNRMTPSQRQAEFEAEETSVNQSLPSMFKPGADHFTAGLLGWQ